MENTMQQPQQFFNVIFHEKNNIGENVALCAGYERGTWRNDQLADHVMEWLPEFALSYNELSQISHHNAVRMAKKAAKLVYQTPKYGNRGEFGEIFLHIAIRQVYQSIPAISKIYYKSAVNETVKGFDAVHVVQGTGGLELWIGETKFYTNLNKAISDVAAEIVLHLETDYLKNEFLLIANKIDENFPNAKELQALLDSNNSLDTIFSRVCIPVLLTYESKSVAANSAASAEYLSSINVELNKAYDKLRKDLGSSYLGEFGANLPVTIHVILVPLHDKKKLVASLDKRLKELQ
jgi:hypothetical protein